MGEGGGGESAIYRGNEPISLDIFPPQGGVCLRGRMIKELLL